MGPYREPQKPKNGGKMRFLANFFTFCLAVTEFCSNFAN